jgi:hypothetical protein
MKRYILDLRSSWAKAKHAKEYIDILRVYIERKAPNGKMLWVARKFDADQRAIIYYVERLVEISDDWSLVIGDAVHNLRGALDHLAWQLAIRYFKGVEPDNVLHKSAIKVIQFPVVEEKRLWPNHQHRKYTLKSDARKLKKFQPFKMTKKQLTKGRHILKEFFGFAGVSNVDKHRKIQLAHRWVSSFRLTYHGAQDCIPADGSSSFQPTRPRLPDDTTKPGDEIFRVPIEPTGPNPDVNLEPEFTGSVAIRGDIDILDALDKLFASVVAILRTFS